MLALFIGLTYFTGLVMARSGGVSGNSQSCGPCHGSTPDPGVTVSITGIPPTYTPTNSYPLQVSVAGNPPNGGGFDLSVTAGTLTTTDPNARILNSEATNSNEGARSWSVVWQAPAPGAGTVTFYVAGLTSNNDGSRNGDAWATAVYTSDEIISNRRPTISLTNPTGAQDWTGGSSHIITWTMSDDLTPVSNLKVYLNYSSSPSSGTIAGPLTGLTSFDWTVPTIDATDAVVNATVIDEGGLKNYSQVPVPKIDSTNPTLGSGQPTGINVLLTAPIIVVFSETMNTVATEVAFQIVPNPGGLVFTWSQTTFPDDTMTVDHLPFAPSTMHTVTIGNGAKDVSDPGNGLVAGPQPNPWGFTTVSSNAPPTITVSLPAGGESWTGGSMHDISWTASDVEDPLGSLLVWVNYSLTGAAPFNMQVTGLQGVSASSSPFTWIVPLENSATVIMNATVIDTDGARGYDLSSLFEVDSVAPSVASVNPSNGASGIPTNVNILATWTEPMNRSSTESAFSLKDTITWTTVPGTFSWVGNTMTFNPTPLLAMSTLYSANITTAAMDDSDTGNSLTSPYVWTFTTSTGADTNPPQLSSLTALPDPQEVFLLVNISLEVQDDVAVDQVWLNVTDPLGGSINTTMTIDMVSSRYFVEQPNSVVGLYTAFVWAVDTSGNWNSMSTQFTMVDTTPPQVSDLTAVPNPVEVNTLINLSAIVSDNYALAGAWVIVTAPDLTSSNNSMTPGARYYYNAVPTQLGTYSYRVVASDTGGLWATASSSFVSQDTTPPVAHAGADQAVSPSTLVTFDGSASTDNYGVENYTWVFTDGDGPHTLYGVSPSYNFVNFTTVLVTLTVTDFSSNSDQDTMWVNVTDGTAPVADAGPDQTIDVGQTANFDGGGSTDNVGIVSFEWTFNDGGPVTLTGVQASHQFNTVGDYTVTLTVADQAGNTDTDTLTVHVVTSGDTEPPSAPMNLAVQPGGPGALQLSWEANTESDLAGYRLYRSLTPGGPYVMINPDVLLTATSYLDEKLAGGQTYYYVVTAIDTSDNESQRSNEASGHVAEIPIGDRGTELGITSWVIFFIGSVVLLTILTIWLFRGLRRKDDKIGDEPEGGETEEQQNN